MSEPRKTIDRRALLQTATCAAGLGVVGSVLGDSQAAETCPTADTKATAGKPRIRFKDEEFQGSDGKFDVEKGKDAVIALCQYHGYPIYPDFREQLWVSDYNTGQFTKLGLAALMFMNNEEDRYMLMDLFLLPNQMLPEHWHLDGEKNPAKREGWLVRWGLSHIVGIGEPNLGKDVVIPKIHMGGKATTEHEIVAGPGMFVPLAKVYSRHWQYAGPEGAIITEVANVHTNSSVRHSDPALNKYFLES